MKENKTVSRTFLVIAVIYVTCLLDCPWVYPLVEITVFQAMYMYMHKTHEKLCASL